MADRDNRRSRVAAFASLPATRLGMLSDSGNRQSQNVEDVTGATILDKILASIPASAQGYAGDIAWLYRQGQLRPWRQTAGEHMQEAGNMLPDLDLRRNFAEGGTVDDILSAYSEPVRSWPGEQALDDEARANYAAMHPEAPKKLRPDEAFRGTFLPFRETTQGKHEWAVPGFLMDVADAAKAIHASSGTSLGPAIRPSQYSPEAFEQILGHGMAGALAGIAGSMPRVLAKPSAGMTELGIFGGRSAKTADQAMLAKAEDMAAQGVPREKIWSDTGWFQGADGKWRFEIDDSGAAIGKSSGRLDKVLSHPELYEAYPAMKGIRAKEIDGLATLFAQGGYREPTWLEKMRGINGRVLYTTDKNKNPNVLLHEAQHGVQRQEGFGTGSSTHHETPLTPDQRKMLIDARERRVLETAELWNPSRFHDFAKWPRSEQEKYATRYRQIKDGAREEAERDLNVTAYGHTAGEVEARTAEKRANLTEDQRRSRPPWLDYDIPESQQIVRFGDK